MVRLGNQKAYNIAERREDSPKLAAWAAVEIVSHELAAWV
jgi:hypothetical protein